MSQCVEQFKADLSSPLFQMGAANGKWKVERLIENENSPIAYISVRAAKRENSPEYYTFRFKIDNYPTLAPEICLWDIKNDCQLAKGDRPIGINNVAMIFRSNWQGMDHLYAPYERCALATHLNDKWPEKHKDLCWASGDNIMKIMNDLYLNLNSTDYHGVG